MSTETQLKSIAESFNMLANGYSNPDIGSIPGLCEGLSRPGHPISDQLGAIAEAIENLAQAVYALRK